MSGQNSQATKPKPTPSSVITRYTIMGLRRSGNHALINWIINQAPAPCAFYNDVDPANPYENRWLKNRDDVLGKDTLCMLTSCEDRLLTTIRDAKEVPTEFPQPERHVSVLILRNPYNMMASRLKHSEVKSESTTYISGLNTSEMWISYAREFLGKTNIISGDKVCVNYDKWAKDADYRRELAAAMHLTFTDKGRDDVTGFGEGSSFDKDAFSGSASEMQTDKRWQAFRDQQDYREMLRDPLLHHLAKECFELSDDLKEFIDNELMPSSSRQVAWRRHMKLSVMPGLVAFCRNHALPRWLYQKVGRKLLGRG